MSGASDTESTGGTQQVEQAQPPRSQMLQLLGFMNEQIAAIRGQLDALIPLVEAQESQSEAARGAGVARSPTSSGHAWGLSAHRQITHGDITIDNAARMVRVSGRPVDLAPIEYKLLSELAVNAGTLLTHDQLLHAVWESGADADASRLRNVIKELRRKLGDDARNPRYIVTVPRVGYRMADPDEAIADA